MAWGWVVRGLIGIVGSWWLMDDVIHALFASEAKRFLRACGGFVNLRIWARAQGPPIGAGSLQGRSKPANLPVSGWWARKALEMPMGMASAVVVSRQPSGDGAQVHCWPAGKSANWRNS